MNPTALSRDIVAALRGSVPERAQTFTGDLHRFAGTYEGIGRGRRTHVEVKVEGNALVATNLAAPAQPVLALKHSATTCSSTAM